MPIGADSNGNEVIGDLYAVFYDKNKGIVTDHSVLFPDAPKAENKMMEMTKPKVVKRDYRLPANLLLNEPKKEMPGAVMSGNSIYLDMKKLGVHPHAK